MLRLACCSAVTLIALFAAQPAPSSPPPPASSLEAGGCGWWQCSTGGELVPSMFVCRAQCPTGVCSPVNVC